MSILIPVLIVCAIGLIAGVGLSVASIIMAVPVDEKAERIREALPGANCGACGYSGCDAYAKALSEGAKMTTLCAPGGAEAAGRIAEILGVSAGVSHPKSAVVHCRGDCTRTKTAYDYEGVPSCRMAAQLLGGPGSCNYGCIGFGDCVSVCDYNAVQICDGVAMINPLQCKACRKCVTACPKSLISIEPVDEPKAMVLCSNRDKGGAARKQCQVSCIGCMRCVKACEFDAVQVIDQLARVDSAKCTACGKCVEVCPQKCIGIVDSIQQ